MPSGPPFSFFNLGPAGPPAAALPDLAGRIEALADAGFDTGAGASVCVRFGARAVVSAAGAPLALAAAGHVVELADLDPIRRTGLVLGDATPHAHALLHWLVLRARPDVHASLLDPVPRVAAAVDGGWSGVPIAPAKATPETTDGALAVLGALKTGKAAFVRGHGLLAVGARLHDAVEEALALARAAGDGARHA